ncbi:hypothetical protein JIG36_34405 [Actinoplanes sp. LDG1-06]|uniref:Uncharacterized protein n=1 Tax=Paractinoplanes ovalisporus TaxID=2810368 RepID=A0ABS2AL71_9ACTN|nr:hypothetical protein [Actinoplanes ovalisporus]MBM2620607.1 hypothetical protein [Actinoplanes ovalisporus]
MRYAAVVDPGRNIDAFSGHSLSDPLPSSTLPSASVTPAVCRRDDAWINGRQIDTLHQRPRPTSLHPDYEGQRAYAGVVLGSLDG